VEDFPKSVDRQPSYVPNTYAEDNILSPEQVGGVEDFPKSVEHQPWYVPNTNAEDRLSEIRRASTLVRAQHQRRRYTYAEDPSARR
jgi:hypothetical protein